MNYEEFITAILNLIGTIIIIVTYFIRKYGKGNIKNEI